METPQPAHIAMFSTQGMGHLIPLAELARKLVHLYPTKLTITIIIPDDGSSMKAQKQLLQTLLPSINSIFLPQVSFDDLPEDVDIETRVILSVVRSLPALHQVLMEMKDSSRLSAFVTGWFSALSLDVAKALSIPSYIFYTSPAMALSFLFVFPQLDESRDLENKVWAEMVIRLPGCVPLPGSCLPKQMHDTKTETYKGFLELCRKYQLAEGVIVNSFLELEPGVLRAFEEGGSSNKPLVYPVGPLIRSSSSMDEQTGEPECLKWLEEQPPGSVLYVSFGSGGTLSREQLKELALGLEMSEQRFLLVAKNPHDKARNAAYFDVNIGQENIESEFEYLTKGFVERTKGKGFVVPEWAPQVEVLSHKAVGGFLTHCGWNSVLESVVHGVPFIAWPMYAEQKMNAYYLSEGLKIALCIRESENGLVDCEQIAKLARSLIEGEEGNEIRAKMRDLKDAAAKALSPDGSSTKSLAEVAEKWIATAG